MKKYNEEIVVGDIVRYEDVFSHLFSPLIGFFTTKDM